MAEPTSSFVRPTLAELIDRVSSDLSARLPGKDSRVRRSVLWVLARVFAGAVHLVWGFLAWIARQILPDTADGGPLRRHAAIWGLTPIAATYAQGKVTFTGVNGSAIPLGAIVQRTDGAEFIVQADATIAGGTVDATVKASAAGSAGNCAAGTILSLASPVAGVNSAGTVKTAPDDVAGGLDDETDEALRTRLLDYIAARPQGGSAADYDIWTREVAGVARAFVSPLELGPGTVVVRFSVTGTGAAQIPGPAKVTEVQAHLDTVRPVTAAVTAMAPVGLAVPMTIHVNPNTAEVRAAVQAELDALFTREAEPGGTIPNSHIREAISRAPGEDSHTISAIGGGGGTADVVQAATELAYLGVITWI